MLFSPFDRLRERVKAVAMEEGRCPGGRPLPRRKAVAMEEGRCPGGRPCPELVEGQAARKADR
ncbi:Uncharacterized protein dnm_015430 [Desulfonema magnum]|uniref:Uncharacterized protein n=1 Tax=Desulfonema magnum TaxID=45655 RepID=A0A975BHJ3_9BACT|nr:Uncharacterized protein dnm_015430 [Desulfonema magnum]